VPRGFPGPADHKGPKPVIYCMANTMCVNTVPPLWGYAEGGVARESALKGN